MFTFIEEGTSAGDNGLVKIAHSKSREFMETLIICNNKTIMSQGLKS